MIYLLSLMAGIGVSLLVAVSLRPRRTPEALAGRPIGAALRAGLAAAGLGSVPVVVVVIVCVLVSVFVGGALLGTTGIVSFAVLAAAAVPVLGFLGLRARARRIRGRRRLLWPDVVDHLIAHIRSGKSIPAAVAGLADGGPSEFRSAFAGFASDYNATADAQGALIRLKDGFADPVADRIVETLRMARDVGGGDTVAVLLGLGEFLREENAARQELAARKSWITNAAVLGAIAPWVLLMLLATRPEAAAAYASPAGTALIAAGVVVSALAYAAMSALGRLGDERRWFR